MSLRVSTTGTDVFLKDLGKTLVHPTINYDLTQQFSAIDLRESEDLTIAIGLGFLDVNDGSNFIHKDDYDPDEFLIQELGYNVDSLYISHDELASVNDILINKTGVFPLNLNSTASVTRNIYSPAGRFVTWQLSIGDIVVVSGSSAADGTYTVESVTDQQNFIVVESIANSTNGTVNIYHPGGATKIGIDSSTLTYSNATNLQDVLEDINTVSGIEATSKIGQFSVSLKAQRSCVINTVSGLSQTPTIVGGYSIRETGVLVQSGLEYILTVDQLNNDGFDYIIQVGNNEYWPGPGNITLNIGYTWV